MKHIKLVPAETNIGFLRLRMPALIFSLVMMAASIALFAVRGVNLGIDFAGGNLVEIATEQKLDVGQIRGLMAPLNFGEVSVQEIHNLAGDDERYYVQIRIERQPADEAAGIDENQAQTQAFQKVREALGAAIPGIDYRRNESVGPTVSGELVRDGILSIGIAVALVLVYIWFRFEWHFGVGAVIALVHDVVLTVGFFALTQLEFNLSIIAAILTIIGYSLNDTVVVYDRIREKLRKYQKMGLTELLDSALNKTLARTLMTSLTTLIALLSLFIFGGTVIQGFTAAMIWGVFVGTYSSIFIATPALVYLKLRRSAFDDAEPIEKQFS